MNNKNVFKNFKSVNFNSSPRCISEEGRQNIALVACV